MTIKPELTANYNFGNQEEAVKALLGFVQALEPHEIESLVFCVRIKQEHLPPGHAGENRNLVGMGGLRLDIVKSVLALNDRLNLAIDESEDQTKPLNS